VFLLTLLVMFAWRKGLHVMELISDDIRDRLW
jgi:hypothetical protein